MSAMTWQEPVAPPPMADNRCRWYAVHTRSRHEKMVAKQLRDQGITTFLPIATEVRRWSDRRKLVEFPVFSCYAFVNLPWLPEFRGRVMSTNGVLGLVTFGGSPVPIPDAEIESVRKMVVSMVPYTPYHFLKIGQRVRVRGGSLDGVEGILLARRGEKTLVISIEPIQRSLAIAIDGYSLESI